MGALWVFHRGALGDSVLLWPALRACARRGSPVVLVSDAGKARLAARYLPLIPLNAEQDRFNALWRADARPAPISGVDEVIAMVAGDPASDGPTGTWLQNARTMFPGARIRPFPGRVNRVEPRGLERDTEPLLARSNPAGPILMHVGAGGESKRWPMERWLALASGVNDAGLSVRLIAGEVERERLDHAERDAFERAGGLFLDSLDALADEIERARLFLSADTGPAHLAAQIGVPTLTLFGPTDPALWAPLGPITATLAPPVPTQDMKWASVDDVRARTIERSRSLAT